MGDRVGVVAHICRQSLDRVAGPLANALNAACGIALENRLVLGKGNLLGRVLCRLPVRVVGAAFDVVDHLAVELERNAQLDQSLDPALPRKNAIARRRDTQQMPGADRGQGGAAWAVQIDDAASGEVTLQSARSLLLDLRPRRVGDWGKLAVEVVHDRGVPLSEPMPSEPSGTGGVGCAGSVAGAGAAVSAAGGASEVTSSRNVADGAKKRLPVTARLKSRIRS